MRIMDYKIFPKSWMIKVQIPVACLSDIDRAYIEKTGYDSYRNWMY